MTLFIQGHQQLSIRPLGNVQPVMCRFRFFLIQGLCARSVGSRLLEVFVAPHRHLSDVLIEPVSPARQDAVGGLQGLEVLIFDFLHTTNLHFLFDPPGYIKCTTIASI